MIYGAWTEWRTEDDGNGNPHYEKRAKERQEAWEKSPEAAALKELLQKEQLHEEKCIQRAAEFERKKSALESGKAARDEARGNRSPKSPYEIPKVLSAAQVDKRMEKIAVVRKTRTKTLMKP